MWYLFGLVTVMVMQHVTVNNIKWLLAQILISLDIPSCNSSLVSQTGMHSSHSHNKKATDEAELADIPAACTTLLSSSPPLWPHGFCHAETWSLKALWKTQAVESRGNISATRTGWAEVIFTPPLTSLVLQISFSLRCSSMSGARCFSHWDARFTTRLALASTWDCRAEQKQGSEKELLWGWLRVSTRSFLTWSFCRLLSASGNRSIVFFFTCVFSSFLVFSISLCFSSSNTYQQSSFFKSICF